MRRLRLHNYSAYGMYKPLRNHIRKLGLADSLFVIHAYIQNLQFDRPIPDECEVIRQYAGGTKLERLKLITEWNLETLCKEVILHATDSVSYPDTLRRWNTIGRAVNKLKTFEEFLGDKVLSGSMVLLELHRTAHRQFPWQMSRPTGTNTMRYLNLYKDPALESIIQKVIGLSVNEIFLIGLSLFGVFGSKLSMSLPPIIEIPNLTSEAVVRFFQHFSLSLEDLKVLLASELQLNDRFPYAYNSLRAYPLIHMRHSGHNNLVCPMPTLLFWRFTAGLYYEIYTHPDFANAYGNAFQAYVGSILRRGTQLPQTKVFQKRNIMLDVILKGR